MADREEPTRGPLSPSRLGLRLSVLLPSWRSLPVVTAVALVPMGDFFSGLTHNVDVGGVEVEFGNPSRCREV